MTLGAYVEALRRLPSDAEVPLSEMFSWRGSYDELSVDPAERNSAAVLLADAEQALAGKAFTGYKGGEFKMSRFTPIWADPYGDYFKRMLLSVEFVGGEVVVTVGADDDE